MRQQVANGDRPLRRPRLVSGVRFVELRDDDGVLVLGQVFRDIVIELQLALVDEHHDRRRRHRLGHRRDVEDRVLGHRHVPRDAHLAERLVVEHAVATDDRDYDAGHVAPGDRLLQVAGERGAPLLRHRRRSRRCHGDGEGRHSVVASAFGRAADHGQQQRQQYHHALHRAPPVFSSAREPESVLRIE
jgi:hypothetical protein